VEAGYLPRVSELSGTWHYGLVARWWAEFNKAGPEELDYYRLAIKRFGEPVLDLGCGAGRVLLPLVAEGFDVDGVDVSADMIAAAQAGLGASQSETALFVQPLHELRLHRTYGTAIMSGVLGIGGRRDQDSEALRRIFRLLRPGGALLVVHQLPYGDDESGWADWLPGHRAGYPAPWPSQGDRKQLADGDEIELVSRIEDFDPLGQQLVLGMRARLWRLGTMAREESYTLKSCLYFAQEIVLMLAQAGFAEVAIEGPYTGKPASGDDATVIFVTRKKTA
jgi:SAM-dependent methyltransferase